MSHLSASKFYADDRPFQKILVSIFRNFCTSSPIVPIRLIHLCPLQNMSLWVSACVYTVCVRKLEQGLLAASYNRAGHPPHSLTSVAVLLKRSLSQSFEFRNWTTCLDPAILPPMGTPPPTGVKEKENIGFHLFSRSAASTVYPSALGTDVKNSLLKQYDKGT